MENIIADVITCPVCGGEMIRNSMDDKSSDYNKNYICHNCGIDTVVNEELEF